MQGFWNNRFEFLLTNFIELFSKKRTIMYNPFVKIKQIALTIIFICLCHLAVNAQIKAISIRYPVIPFPAHLAPRKGDFIINKKTSIVIQNESFRPDAVALKQLIKEVGGISC